MTIFGLVAYGPDDLTGRNTSVMSKRMFRTRESAEAWIEQFKKIAGSGGIRNVDFVSPDSTVVVVEYELEE